MISRTRLFHRLDAARKRRIVWISAPPGAGKTTLAATYLVARKLRNLWYQLDEGDVDAAGFFYYLGLAAKKAAPRRKKSLPLLTPEYALGQFVFARRYFEMLYDSLTPPFVVVLDNYQAVAEDAFLHEIIRVGLEQMPEGGSAIVISREMPPPPFARLRASQSMELIDWEALRLDDRELTEIMRLNNRPIRGHEEVKRLLSCTGGWVAGLSLMLEAERYEESADVSLDPHSRGSARQGLFDYFATEILKRQDPDTRNFLLQVSLLPRLSSDMAYALTGMEESGRILAGLYRNRYFVERHAHENSLYQFHPLFREFLLNQVRQDLDRQSLVSLQRSAALLLEQAGQIESALQLMLEAEDWPGVVRIVCQHALMYVVQGRGATVAQWIGQVPQAVLELHPWLEYWLGVSLMVTAPREVQQPLERAYRRFKKLGDIPGMCMGLASIIDTFSFGWYDFYSLDEWIEELEVLLAEHPQLPSPELQSRVAVAMFVALLHRRPDHPDMPHWSRQTREVVRNMPGVSERVVIGMHLATYYVWWGRHGDMLLLLEELRPVLKGDGVTPVAYIAFYAMEAMYYSRSLDGDGVNSAIEGLRCAEESGVYVINPLLLGFAAIASLHAGDIDSARSYLSRLAALSVPGRLNDHAFYHWCMGHLLWLQGNIADACDHARQCTDIALKSGSAFHRYMTPISLAKILVEAGEHREAAEITEDVLPAIRSMGNPILEYECLLVMAKSALAQRDRAIGLDALRAALEVMKRQGAKSTIWWNPRWITPLLAEALDEGIELEFVQSLIRMHGLTPEGHGTELEDWPWRIRIYTFGGFSLTLDDEPVRSAGKTQRKPIDLLKVLVAFGGQRVSEVRIIDALWPDAEVVDARNSLKMALHRLRKLLRNEQAVKLEGGRISLNPHLCWTDATAFQRLQVRTNEREKDDSVQTVRLEKAIELYKGAFMKEDTDDSWVLEPRERLRNRFVHAVLALGARYENAGNWKRAVGCYESAIGAEALAEPLYLKLIRSHIGMGHPGEALATYERYAKLLTAHFGIGPSDEAKAIVRELKAEGTHTRGSPDSTDPEVQGD